MSSGSIAMARSTSARVSLRVAALLLLLLMGFYVGRPLYWKLSATIHDIRHNKQTVQQGFSKFVLDAQRSVRWIHDESDSGLADESSVQRLGADARRRILRVLDPNRNGWPR